MNKMYPNTLMVRDKGEKCRNLKTFMRRKAIFIEKGSDNRSLQIASPKILKADFME